MNKLVHSDITPYLSNPTVIQGTVDDISFNELKNLNTATPSSLIFYTGTNATQIEHLEANTLLVTKQVTVTSELIKVIIQVDEPIIDFSNIGNRYFVEEKEASIHPSVVKHDNSQIDDSAFIGPNCYIGDSIIGKNVVIHANVTIHDKVTIGDYCIIHSGTVIGTEGFGYNKDKNGISVQFPHIGGVTLEKNVVIGANTCIDRGSIEDTIIGENSKIDNLVHIAHNVKIGRNVFVIAHSMIAGSVVLEDNSYIAPNASVRDGVTIGKNGLLGMSASLLKNLPANEIWTGNPAKEISELKKLNQKLGNLK